MRQTKLFVFILAWNLTVKSEIRGQNSSDVVPSVVCKAISSKELNARGNKMNYEVSRCSSQLKSG